MLKPICCCLSLLICTLPVQAQEPTYDRVSLSAEASREVPRDLMHVVLYTEAEHKDPATLSRTITLTLNQAVARARKVEGVEIETGSRYSRPIQTPGKTAEPTISHWREHAEIRLTSSDFARLSELTGELSAELRIASLSFSVSEALRRQHEEQLIESAIQAFQKRARLASQALGGQDYRLVSLDLNGGGMRPVPVMRMATMKAEMSSAPAPDLEAGQQTISLSASGIIEIQRP